MISFFTNKLAKFIQTTRGFWEISVACVCDEVFQRRNRKSRNNFADK